MPIFQESLIESQRIIGIKIRILAFILVALLIPLAVPASGAASVQLTAFTGVFSVDSAAYLARGGSDYEI